MTPPSRAVRRFAALVGLLGMPFRAEAKQAACSDAPLAVQVLGSGGVFASPDRASASYLVWRAGRPIIMIDAGEGSLGKFAEAGGEVPGLELVAISRADVEHMADLGRLLDLSRAVRDRPLRIVGPEAAGAFADLVNAARGDRGAAVDVSLVTRTARFPTVRAADVEVEARYVPHGSWQDPSSESVAYRVRVGDVTVVFGGDQNGTLHAFLDFADDAELLVMHLPLSERADETLRSLYAVPSIVGRVAWQARVDRLLLGAIAEPPVDHPNREAYSGPVIQESVNDMRFRYSGPIEVASDLKCIRLM